MDINVSKIISSESFKPYLEKMEKALEPSLAYDKKIGRYPTDLETSWSALYFDNAVDDIRRIINQFIKSNNLSRNKTDDMVLTDQIAEEALGIRL